MKSWRALIPTTLLILGFALPAVSAQAAIPGLFPSDDRPVNLHAHAASGTAVVTWTAPATNSPVTAYQVLTSRLLTNKWWATSQVAIDYQVPTMAKVTHLVNGVTYHFTVRAATAAGWGPQSAPSNPVTPGSAIPASPTALSVTAEDGSALLRWAASVSPGIDHYMVFVYRSDGSLVRYMHPIHTLSVRVTGLSNYTSYQIAVHTVNRQGMISSGAMVRVMPVGLPGRLATPMNLHATTASHSVWLNWDAVPGAERYAVYIYQLPVAGSLDQSPLVWMTEDLHQPQLFVLRLTSGQRYMAEVRSLKGDGASCPARVTFITGQVSNLLHRWPLVGSLRS